MRVAYVFSSAGQTIDYVLGDMILPQLERGDHGAEVLGMFFFHDNVYALREGDPIGERLASVTADLNRDLLVMLCNRCAVTRGLAERDGQYDTGRARYRARNAVDGVTVGCFPDLYAALEGTGLDQVITL